MSNSEVSIKNKTSNHQTSLKNNNSDELDNQLEDQQDINNTTSNHDDKSESLSDGSKGEVFKRLV